MNKRFNFKKILVIVSFICFAFASVFFAVPNKNKVAMAEDSGSWSWTTDSSDSTPRQTGATLPNATVGEYYYVKFFEANADCDPYSISYSSTGSHQSPVFSGTENFDGSISGQPTYAGIYSVVVEITEGTTVFSKTYSLTVEGEVTLTFDDGWYDCDVPEAITDSMNEVITLPNVTDTVENMTFVGWCKDLNNVEVLEVGSNYTLTQYETLYAYFVENAKFVLKGRSASIFETEPGFSYNPTLHDYTFAGWSLTVDASTGYVSKGSNNIYDSSDFEINKEYYAIWLNDCNNVVIFTDGYFYVVLNDSEDNGSVNQGWSWDCSEKTLTLNGVTIENIDSLAVPFFECSCDTMKIVLNGNNVIGLEKELSDLSYYEDILGGIYCDGDIVITGAGNLTIYDFNFGIKAEGSITFDTNFSGVLTIHDKGADIPSPPPICCLYAGDDIVICAGTFYLYNLSSNSIHAGGDFTINSGTVICSSNTQAIYVGDTFTTYYHSIITAKTNSDGTGSDVSVSITNNVVTNYSSAKYFKIEQGFQVVYYDNDSTGGNVPTDSNVYKLGASATVLGNTGSLERAGYKFLGWNTEQSATTASLVAGNSYTIPYSDTSLYAIWQDIPHTDSVMTFNKVLNRQFKGGDLDTGNYYLFEDVSLDNSEIFIDSGDEVNICLNGHTLNVGSFYIKNTGILNFYDCKTTKHYFTINGTTGLWTLTNETTSNYVEGGVITGATSSAFFNMGTLTLNNINAVGNQSTLGAVILNKGTASVFDSKLFGNVASESGGAIINSGNTYDNYKVLIKNSELKYNKAKNGGAIFSNSYLIIENSTISDNIATENGGGIYAKNSTTGTCLIEGTKITMADGTTKNIEDIVDGDLVKTFSHETGMISTQKVIYIFTENIKAKAFYLHFTNGIDLGIVSSHALFEKDSLQYVTVSEENASEYIGKYFYNANDCRWEQLLSVSSDNTLHKFYAIDTAYTYNHLANGMLTMIDEEKFMLNAFEIDENLKYNETKKQADIEQYGLFAYEDSCFSTPEEFDMYNMKYINVVLGKGLVSFAEMVDLRIQGVEYTYQKDEKQQNKNQNTFSAMMFGSSPTSINDYISGAINGTVIFGDNAVISGNSVETSANNLYINEASLKIFGSTGINVGLTLSTGKGEFIYSVGNQAYCEFFTSDIATYGIKVAQADDYLETNKIYDFSIDDGCYFIYNLNGYASGTTPNNSIVYCEGRVITTFAELGFTRPGYAFLGWNTSSTAETGLESYTITAQDVENGSLELYAIWHERQTITINENIQYYFESDSNAKFEIKDAPSGVSGFKIMYLDGSNYTEIVPTSQGIYTVKITRTQDDNYNSFSKVIVGGFVIGYQLTYSNGLASGTAPVDDKVYFDDGMNAKNATIKGSGSLVRPGYSFDGWFDGEDIYKENDIYVMNSSTTLVPVWKIVVNEQPQKSNDFEFIVSATDVEYQWYIVVGVQKTVLQGETGAKLQKTLVAGKYVCEITYISYETIEKTELSNEIMTQNVVFDINGGNGIVPTTLFGLEGRKVIIPTATISKENKVFDSWNTQLNEQGNKFVAGDEVEIDEEEIKLYAIWKDKPFVVINENPQEYAENDSNILFVVSGTPSDNFVVKYYVNDVWTTVVPTTIGKYKVLVERTEDNQYHSYSKEIIDGLVIKKFVIKDNCGAETPNVIANCEDGFADNIVLEVVVKVVETKLVENQELKIDYKTKLGYNEILGSVYDVKLLQNGVEIQPSQIKEGAIITVKLLIPQELIGKEIKILHVHSENDIETISKGKVADIGTYVIEDGYIVTKITKLSEFAFVYKTDCFIHWILLIELAVFVGFIAICWFILKKRKFDLLTYIGFGVYDICLVVTALFSKCKLCNSAVVINIIALIVGIVLFAFGKKISKKSKKKNKKLQEKTIKQDTNKNGNVEIEKTSEK